MSKQKAKVEEPKDGERKVYNVPKEPPLQNPNEMQVIINALEEQRNAALTQSLQNKVESERWRNCFYQLVQEHGALRDANEATKKDLEETTKKLTEAEALIASMTDPAGTPAEPDGGMPTTEE